MSKPRVELDFTKQWCPRHLEPFRARWPEGAGVAMVKLFEAFVADEETIARAPKDGDGKASAHALDALVAEHSPLCCYLGDERLKPIYEAAGVEPA